MTDTIADLINRINNAKGSDHESLEVPFSKMKMAILDVLKELGYIANYKRADNGIIKIGLSGRAREFNKIRRLSSPSRRIYSSSKNIPRPMGGFGEVIVSTPRGVLSGTKARKSGIGGEIICEVS